MVWDSCVGNERKEVEPPLHILGEMWLRTHLSLGTDRIKVTETSKKSRGSSVPVKGAKEGKVRHAGQREEIHWGSWRSKG